MAAIGTNEVYWTVDRLIDNGEWEEARALLANQDEDEACCGLLKLKLALRDGSLAPWLVEARVVQFLRKDPEALGARELFQEASALSFQQGQSSMSHSHPPPPVEPNREPKH